MPGLWWRCLGSGPWCQSGPTQAIEASRHRSCQLTLTGRQCSSLFVPAISPQLSLSYCFHAWCFFGANISTLEMFGAGQVQTFWVHNLLQVNALYSFKFTFPLSFYQLLYWSFWYLSVIENNRPEGAEYMNPSERLIEEGCVHMMSLGSKALMIQVWADPHAGTLIFRYWFSSAPMSRSCT